MLKIEGQNVPLIDVEALNSFWTLVHNFKYIIVDPKKLKLFNIYLDGYKFLFEPDNKIQFRVKPIPLSLAIPPPDVSPSKVTVFFSQELAALTE